MAQNNVSNEFPANDEMPVTFPEFNEGGESANRRRAIPWCDVPMYVYFKVLNTRKVAKWNKSMATILTLQRRGGSTFETWATSLIEKDIDEQMAEADKAGKCLFIKSLDKKTSKSGREYWNFVFFVNNYNGFIFY